MKAAAIRELADRYDIPLSQVRHHAPGIPYERGSHWHQAGFYYRFDGASLHVWFA